MLGHLMRKAITNFRNMVLVRFSNPIYSDFDTDKLTTQMVLRFLKKCFNRTSTLGGRTELSSLRWIYIIGGNNNFTLEAIHTTSMFQHLVKLETLIALPSSIFRQRTNKHWRKKLLNQNHFFIYKTQKFFLYFIWNTREIRHLWIDVEHLMNFNSISLNFQ